MAASMTFALAAASIRHPKLLQPSPTTETWSEPILRVCMSSTCASDVDAQLLWGAQATSLLATAAVPRPFYAYDLGHGRKVFGKLPKTAGWQPALPRRR